MAGFIGRKKQIHELEKILDQVSTNTDSKPGRALLMRGRRRVGKSRLVEEFLARSRVPGVFFAASKQPTDEELRLFSQAVLESNLPDKETFRGLTFASWDAALRQLANILPKTSSSIIVIDELPYLMESDQAFEGTLQKIFDRELSRNRVFLIGIGSDLSMMEALNQYNRPFHQRATEMVIPPLTPIEVGSMLGLNPAEAFDAYLITGGLPMICQAWESGQTMWEFLKNSLSYSTSALIVSGERSLAAEFPPDAKPRPFLTAIGSDFKTFTNIGQAAGNPTSTSLQRGLTALIEKRMVIAELPLSTRPSKEKRYRISDPYMRFWLRFIEPNFAELERGRGDRVFQRIQQGWSTWRGSAIEPIVRDAIDLLPAMKLHKQIPVVGAYWTRSNNPEIDIIIADRKPVAKTIFEVGSIKWFENKPFFNSDLNELIRSSTLVPGSTPETEFVIVSRAGFQTTPAPHIRQLSPKDLIQAWA